MQKPAHIGKLADAREAKLAADLELQNAKNAALSYYASNKWDLVPVRRNGKEPFEMEWPTKTHTNIVEWHQWLETGLNMGVKTGKVSGIVVLDFDSDDVPEPFKSLLKDYKGFLQRTKKGWHFVVAYDADIPNSNFELNGCHVDVRSDGGQVVLFPSTVDGNSRQILSMETIPVMTPDLKAELLKHIGVRTQAVATEAIQESLATFDTAQIQKIGEGNRNNFLIHLGGILQKKLSTDQTHFVLNVANQELVDPPLNQVEMYGIIGSISKYKKFDEKDLAERILMYLKIVKEADARDVKEVMGEAKEKVDRALAWLVKEGLIIKHRRMFQIVNRANWKTTLDVTANRIDFKMPYFDDVAHFNYGDMILVGAQTKTGKTHIAMNILKQLVDQMKPQGKKPYYLSSESGSRFQQVASHLGMGEGDFNWDEVPDPTSIELEKDAVTIIDWLQIEDKSQTDTVLKHFVGQLIKTKGVLIIFMQLKETDGNWFAPNMVAQYPALAARYSYDDETGLLGKWTCKPIREPKQHMKSAVLACEYEPNSKILKLKV